MTRDTIHSGRAALAAILALGLLAACETVEGAGRDLQDAGATLTEEAQAAQTP